MMWRPRAAHLTLVMVLLVIATAGWPQSAAAMPFAQLADVSCGSLGDCAAVGTAPASDRDTAIVYTLRGGAWTTGTTASLPADAVTGSASFSFLRAVSCPAVGSCLAVGSYTNQAGASAPLLLPEAGGSWAAGTTAALPTNAAGGMRLAVTLDAVTCVSAGNCTAVGWYSDAAGSNQALIVTETDGFWATGLQALLPTNAIHDAGRQFATLSSVSCPSAGNCTAAGVYVDGARNPRGMLLTETNGRWARGVEARVPGDAARSGLMNPSGHFNYGINQVSCGSPGNCTAIGEYANRVGFEQGLLVTETRGRWGRGVTPRLPANAATARLKKADVLFSLSCTSAGNCSAVGWYADRAGNGDPLVVSQRSGRWARGTELRLPANASSPRGALASALQWVACPSAGSCTAVGDYAVHGKEEGLLATEANGRWARATQTRLPAGGAEASAVVSDEQPGVYRVSCVTVGSCAAIGTYDRGRSTSTQAMLLFESHGTWGRGVEALP